MTKRGEILGSAIWSTEERIGLINLLQRFNKGSISENDLAIFRGGIRVTINNSDSLFADESGVIEEIDGQEGQFPVTVRMDLHGRTMRFNFSELRREDGSDRRW